VAPAPKRPGAGQERPADEPLAYRPIADAADRELAEQLGSWLRLR
jgi:hypothetical protein